MFGILLTLGAVWFGYGTARRFVRERLRYVDSALTPGAAIIAAVGATVIAWPIMYFLPIVTTGTALAFGLAVGVGTRAGATDVKQGYRISDGS
jgi:hypothetical protein